MGEFDSRADLVEQAECLFRIVFPKWGSFVERATCAKLCDEIWLFALDIKIYKSNDILML